MAVDRAGNLFHPKGSESSWHLALWFRQAQISSTLAFDTVDGQALDEKEGPYRLVVPTDKRPIRWLRMLSTIRIANVKDLPAIDAAKSPGTPTK